ncbi:SMP-30/gluconolactonase/LRE family protein [Sulfitobacter geojensis]|uniref:SMP-30/gluconolactonase/LRE family protein n=1 Tax=Sulfitobacter geojensis TaxID=1342299 RepID=UPI0036DF7599
MSVFDPHACTLGEGPLWHPERNTLFWFDILEKRLFSRQGDTVNSWDFEAHFSAAGWVDKDTLVLASETALWRFDIPSGDKTQICALEADNPVTRSNDGRADPWGGFWIGTMGKEAQKQAGAIYRYYRGELRKLVSDITITNAICFAPDRSCAYYTDTVTQKIMRQPLNAGDGWPVGAPEVFIDLSAKGLNPDGAVTDADGTLWVAIWGSSCVIAFGHDGTEQRRLDVPARQPTCPAFGGDDLRDLYVTSANEGLPQDAVNGATYLFADMSQGLPEPKVIL